MLRALLFTLINAQRLERRFPNEPLSASSQISHAAPHLRHYSPRIWLPSFFPAGKAHPFSRSSKLRRVRVASTRGIFSLTRSVSSFALYPRDVPDALLVPSSSIERKEDQGDRFDRQNPSDKTLLISRRLSSAFPRYAFLPGVTQLTPAFVQRIMHVEIRACNVT